MNNIDFGAAATQAAFRYQVTDLSGNPITNEVDVGDEFNVEVFVRDTRTSAPGGFGVFAAYQDMTFTSTRATVVGTPTFTTAFANGRSGTVQSSVIDELGAFVNALSPTGQDELLVATVRFRATQSGAITISGDPADSSPDHDVLVFGGTTGVPANRVSHAAVVVNVAPPVSDQRNDIYNFDEDTPVHSLDVLINDALAGTTPNLTITAVSATNRSGTVTIASNGKSLNYTSALNFFGEETFTYTGTDGSSPYTATVTVQVVPVNDNPDAVNDAMTVQRGSANNFLDVLGNDLETPDQNDPNENLQVATVGTSQRGGTVVRGSSGTHILYTPPANFVGTDTFTYTINDRTNGTGITDTATVTITVSGAVNDTFTAVEDSTINSFDPLLNDSSASGTNTNLTITAVTQGNRGGTITVETGSKKVNYKPAANVFGEETFTYTTSDVPAELRREPRP